MYRIEQPFDPISEVDLNVAEARLRLSLPDDYRRFLLQTNGGVPVPDSFEIPGCDARAIVGVLYGVLVKDPGLNLEWNFGKLKKVIPSGFLPIGEDPGGCPLLLGTTGEERGCIFFWDRKHLLAASTDEGNTYEVANGIFDLLERLAD